MKIIGLDPATTTGYSILECDNNEVKLIDFGSIQPPSSFSLPQRLNFYSVELKRILVKHKPDYCAIENLILGISGVKTLAYLARINGVCIQSSFEFLKDRVAIYNPEQWKKNSFPNLDGRSQKWQVQYEVVKFFKLANEQDFINWDKCVNECWVPYEQVETTIHDYITTLKEYKKLARMKATSEEKKDYYKKEIFLIEEDLKKSKINLKSMEKQVNKSLQKIGNEIQACSGISNDIADATSIAYCFYRELNSNENHTIFHTEP